LAFHPAERKLNLCGKTNYEESEEKYIREEGLLLYSLAFSYYSQCTYIMSFKSETSNVHNILFEEIHVKRQFEVPRSKLIFGKFVVRIGDNARACVSVPISF
jgi:hypothetical protein